MEEVIAFVLAPPFPSDVASLHLISTSLHNLPRDEDMVSLKVLVQIQTLLEIAMCRFVLSNVCKNLFDDPVFSTQGFAEKLFNLRSPSKALNLEPNHLVTTAKVSSSPEWNAALNRFISVAESLIVDPLYSSFLMEKYIPDLLFYYAATKQPVVDELRCQVPLQLYVGTLLRALSFYSKLKLALGSNSGKEKDQVNTFLGSELSSLLGLDGGVAAVINEMLGHVPTGNILAYQNVAKMFAKTKESLDRICVQLISILKFARTDSDRQRGNVLIRAVVLTVNEIAKRYNPVNQLVLDPLMECLHHPSGVYEESMIDETVWYFRTVLDAAPPEPMLIDAMAVYVPVLFEIYAYCTSRKLRGAGEAKSALLLYLHRCEANVGAAILRSSIATDSELGVFGDISMKRSSSGGLVIYKALETENLCVGRQLFTKMKPIRTSNEEQEEEEADEDVNMMERCCVLSVLLKTHVPKLLGKVFLQATGSISSFFDSDANGMQVVADVALLRSLLGVNIDEFDKKLLVQGISGILRGCAGALGLWTFESGDNTLLSERAYFALEICPIALAIAAALTSSEYKVGERFLFLQPLMDPLAALSRTNDTTAINAVTQFAEKLGTSSKFAEDHFRKVCTEMSQGALSIRMSVLGVESKLHKIVPDDEDEIFDPIGKSIRSAAGRLISNDPAVKAMGMDDLVLIALQRNPLPSDKHLNSVFSLMVNCLADNDSYVFLTCIRAMSELPATRFEQVVHLLLSEFTSDKSSLVTRVRVGEVLMLVCRRAGGGLYAHSGVLMDAFIQGGSIRRYSPKPKTFDTQGKYISEGSRVESLASFTELELVFRSSCLSNLADVCYAVPIAAFHHAVEISSLAEGILSLERQHAESVGVRRAAAFMLRCLIEGASQVEDNYAIGTIPTQLKDVLRSISNASTFDSDEVVRLHCNVARTQFDQMMKKFLFVENKDKVLRVSLGLERLV